MNFAGMMFGQQPPRPTGMSFSPINWGRMTPASGFAIAGPGGMQPVKPGEQGNVFYGNTPPGEGWTVVGQANLPAFRQTGRDGTAIGGLGNPAGPTLIWRQGGSQQQDQGNSQGGGGSAAPAPGPSIPAPRSLDQSALNAMQAANQQAIDQARATYARQNEDLALTVDQLRNMLIASRNESALAMQQQQAQFAQFMLASSDQTGAARALYEGQLSRQMGGLPTPERSAVSPQFGDARTGGRNAVANTLSNLTILSPGSLGNRQGRGSLVGLQLA